MQYKTVTVSKDNKTGKETVVSEKKGPKKPFKQESISAEEFNNDKKDGSYIQENSATYSVDKKTGKQTKVSEETGPKKVFKQEDISAEEFNKDKSSKTKAALLTAKAEALQSTKRDNATVSSSYNLFQEKKKKAPVEKMEKTSTIGTVITPRKKRD